MQPECSYCKDKPGRKCKQCACKKCGGKNDPNKQILCDECEGAYHIWCLEPALTELPTDDEWSVAYITLYIKVSKCAFSFSKNLTDLLM